MGKKDKGAPFRGTDEPARIRYHLRARSTIIVWTEKYACEAPWIPSDVSSAKRKKSSRGKEEVGKQRP